MNTLLKTLRSLLMPHVHDYGKWRLAVAEDTTAAMYRNGVEAKEVRRCVCGACELRCGKY